MFRQKSQTGLHARRSFFLPSRRRATQQPRWPCACSKMDFEVRWGLPWRNGTVAARRTVERFSREDRSPQIATSAFKMHAAKAAACRSAIAHFLATPVSPTCPTRGSLMPQLGRVESCAPRVLIDEQPAGTAKRKGRPNSYCCHHTRSHTKRSGPLKPSPSPASAEGTGTRWCMGTYEAIRSREFESTRENVPCSNAPAIPQALSLNQRLTEFDKRTLFANCIDLQSETAVGDNQLGRKTSNKMERFNGTQCEF